MRSSTVLALALVAAAGPALSAPVASPVNFARAEPTTPASDMSSEAIKLGTIGTIASFAAPVIGGIIDHFKNKGNPKQRRDAMELEALFARANSGEESDAIKLGTVANIAGIGSSVISAFHNLFGGQKREDIEELFARAFDDESSAMILRPGQKWPHTHFAIARDDAAPADESDAIKLGTVANIASIGSSVVSAFHNLFGGQRRDVEELLARAFDDESSAMVFRPGQKWPQNSWRYKIARDDAGEESDAIKLGTVANIASIGSSVVSAFHNLFGGNQKREILDLLARAEFDESGAFIGFPPYAGGGVPRYPWLTKALPGLQARDAANPTDAESAAVLLGTLVAVAGGNKPQQKRELLEFLARADTTDESDAIKLSTLGNIASIGGSVISAVHNLFSGNQKREFEELLARAAEDDEAAAIKLSTLGNIASIGGSVISAVHNLFSSNNQGQKREFMELLARATSEDVFQARSLNELD